MDYLEKLKEVENLGESLTIIARRAYMLYSINPDEPLDARSRFKADWAEAKARIELCRRRVESEADDGAAEVTNTMIDEIIEKLTSNSNPD